MSLRICAPVLFLLLAVPARAEDPAKELAKIEAQLKKKPDDPALNARKAQCLMKLKKYDEGYAAAERAMQASIKAGDALESILLETVDLGHVDVEIHFNMGPKERKRPETGIVRPVSFRVKHKDTKAGKGAPIETIDWELGMMNGKAGTAALGMKEEGGRHANLGMHEPDMAYKDIREKGLELVKKRNPAPAEEEK